MSSIESQPGSSSSITIRGPQRSTHNSGSVEGDPDFRANSEALQKLSTAQLVANIRTAGRSRVRAPIERRDGESNTSFEIRKGYIKRVARILDDRLMYITS